MTYLKTCDTSSLKRLATGMLYVVLETVAKENLSIKEGQDNLIWIKGDYPKGLYGIPSDWQNRFYLNLAEYRQKSFNQFLVDYVEKAERDFMKPAPLSLKPLPKKPSPVAYGTKPAYPSRPKPVKGEFEKTPPFLKNVVRLNLPIGNVKRKLLTKSGSLGFRK